MSSEGSNTSYSYQVIADGPSNFSGTLWDSDGWTDDLVLQFFELLNNFPWPARTSFDSSGKNVSDNTGYTVDYTTDPPTFV